jgi:two-component system, LuxR family, sensor histidine kinase DctS
LLLLVALLLGRAGVPGRANTKKGATRPRWSATPPVASDIRSALLRNVQTLQSLHSVAPTPIRGWRRPPKCWQRHREMVRLEWRDNRHPPGHARDTPYMADLFGAMGRDRAADVRQACDNARASRARPSRPATSGPCARAWAWS